MGRVWRYMLEKSIHYCEQIIKGDFGEGSERSTEKVSTILEISGCE